MEIMTFFQWLEATPGSVFIRESLLFYPLVETTHVLALGLFLGMIAMLDLRLVGVGLRGVPVSEVPPPDGEARLGPVPRPPVGQSGRAVRVPPV